MVLDIRDLRGDDGPRPVEPVTPVSISPSRTLEQLLERAAGAASPVEQARAVEQLRQVIPGAEGMEYLFAVLGTADDPVRRLVAAQILGFHRQWLSSRSRVKQLVQFARQATDEAMAGALVWALRQRTEACEFLADPRPSVAIEAALGVPANRQTLPLLLDALERLEPPFHQAEVGRVLLGKLRALHPSLARTLVELLLERSGPAGATRLVSLLEWLPQVPLFEIFIEEQRAPDEGPRGEEDAVRSRARQQLTRAARRLLEEAPSAELLRHLLTRSGEDDAFVRRHDGFLRAAMRQADRQAGPELVSHLEHLTFKASEEMVARLAQSLVELSGHLDGPAAAQAAALLESWKGRSAELKLRIYQLQHKLGAVP